MDCRGEAYRQRGLRQLSDYLDTQGLKHGYLLIFEFSVSKEWKSEAIPVGDKQVTAVWV